MICRQRTPLVAILFVVLVGCTRSTDIKGISYDAYAKTQHAEIIDLGGTSDISIRYASERNASDRWFTFNISRNDFFKLVQSVAADHHGPTEILWSESAIFPEKWQPRHLPPSEWQISPADDFKSISWCYATESSYHHGWYFYHDGRNDRGFCWHWRYQWAGEMCEQ